MCLQAGGQGEGRTGGDGCGGCRTPLKMNLQATISKIMRKSNIKAAHDRQYQMYSFLIAAITSYHKRSVFKQCKVIVTLSSFRNLNWLKPRCWKGLFLPGGPRGESTTWYFPASRGTCFPWLTAPSSLKPGQWVSPSHTATC